MSKPKGQPVDLHCKTPELRERGWTTAAIKKLLGAPDKIVDNYNAYGVTHLYLRDRVEAVEKTKEFQCWLAKSVNRKAGAVKATKTKHKATMQYVKDLKIEVPVRPLIEIISDACDHYNSSDRRVDDYYYASVQNNDTATELLNDENGFYQRITVNYLRHELTDYEYELHRVLGKVGVDDAIDSLRQKIYNAIGRAYPDLQSECNRQMHKRRT
jgi:hypothetical protein